MILTTSVNGAAEATGLSRETVRRKIKNRELKAKRVGRRVLVDYQSLARLVSTRVDRKAAD
jgi:excisionase family DNA binding protein